MPQVLHAVQTVFDTRVHSAFTKLPLGRQTSPKHSVRALLSHPPHGEHTVFVAPEQPVLAYCPAGHVAHVAHCVSRVALHGEAAYCPAGHTLHALHTESRCASHSDSR